MIQFMILSTATLVSSIGGFYIGQYFFDPASLNMLNLDNEPMWLFVIKLIFSVIFGFSGRRLTINITLGSGRNCCD